MTVPDPIDVHVGRRLRDIRTSQYMSLQTLGEAVGVSYQQMQKYETGANRVSASQLSRLSKALGVGVGSFFEGLDDASGDEMADAGTLRTAAALGRMEPEVRRAICGLIDAIASKQGGERRDGASSP